MSEDVYVRMVPLMGTLVTIQVVGPGADPKQAARRKEAVERAFAWFHQVEACCTRFDTRSDLMQLTAHVGAAVPASPILFEAVQFALAVAEESGGAFDPTVGHAMERRGFNREYQTGAVVQSAPEPGVAVTYRDVYLDSDRRTITLLRPLLLDLGAVAKGLAIDLAARELQEFTNFAINAGGDLYLGGSNASGAPWSVGIRHPRRNDELIDSVRVSNRAVCTSGDYERRSPVEAEGHHILDPRTGASAPHAASVTVIAPTAMLADALATAAFVLGPQAGIQLLERLGVDGLMISPALKRHATRGMRSDYQPDNSAILPHAQGPSSPDPRDLGRPGGAA
jgi:thiamine biosynthesis lipoprotein